MDQLCRAFAQVFLLVLGAGLSLAGLTWQLYRTNRYLKEALERERVSSSERERQLIRGFSRSFSTKVQSLLESFLRAPTPTLHELVASTEAEFRARASAGRSTESDSTINLTTRELDFTPR